MGGFAENVPGQFNSVHVIMVNEAEETKLETSLGWQIAT